MVYWAEKYLTVRGPTVTVSVGFSNDVWGRLIQIDGTYMFQLGGKKTAKSCLYFIGLEKGMNMQYLVPETAS